MGRTVAVGGCWLAGPTGGRGVREMDKRPTEVSGVSAFSRIDPDFVVVGVSPVGM